ncbi:hypothetical protein [Streptomyces yanii]|uniref:Uncharacterized protein n=1 Tax=Streptomyces yanii TaxID=78510 RepID=A0ABV5R750_9ACTN
MAVSASAVARRTGVLPGPLPFGAPTPALADVLDSFALGAGQAAIRARVGADELEVASFGRLPVAHLKGVGDAGPGDPVQAGQGDEHQFAGIQLVPQ